MMKKLLLLFVLCFSAFTIYAQTHESVNSTGGNATGTGGSVNYSAGQIVFTTHSGANGSVAEGVQQPYEISVVTAIPQSEDIQLILSVYPNPATDQVILSTGNSSASGFSFQLYDAAEKMIRSENISSNETPVGLSGLTASTYFLKVMKNSKEMKTFKIIKNK